MPPPTPKDDWIAAFVAELTIRLRPDIGLKFAETIAANMWPRHKGMKAQDAAKHWAQSRTKPTTP